MKIKHNFEELHDPNIKTLADIIDGSLPDDENSFKYSVFNPYHYPRMANEIMEKLFASKKSKLQELIAELEREGASLITSASQEVKETINKCRNDPDQGMMEKIETDIVCEIFEKIPSYALNLLGLIKIKPEYFPQSYISFEQMLKDFNRDEGRYYDQDEIKKYFSEALKELEKLVENGKKKNEEPVESPHPGQTNQDQPGKKDTPTNSNKNPESQNSSKGGQTPNETNKSSSPNLANLQALKDQVISNITATLNQIPPLTNSDLPSEYQDWESKINNLPDENQIIFFKKKMLLDIQILRKEKIKKQTTGEVSETIDSNFQKAQNSNATIQEKKEALNEIEQYEEQHAYKDASIKEQIKNLKKEVAQDNPTEYRNKIISDLEIKLKNNLLTKEELDNKTQTLIKTLEEQKISDPSQLVETELKIIQAIGQQGATKKISTLKKKVKKFLKLNNETEIDKLKKQLAEFIKSNNGYYQAKKGEAQQLLRQLESDSTISSSYSSESLPFSAQIGIGMGAVLVVLFFTILIWKKCYMASNKKLI